MSSSSETSGSASTSDPSRITLLCLDVDGVLTDGSILIDSSGGELKRFHVRDGLAIKAWQKQGNHVAVITGRGCEALRRRMSELGVEIVLEHVSDKGESIRQVQRQLSISAEDTAFMGDDLADLPAFEHCGYSMAPADADEVVRERATWVAKRPGGQAAVREAIEHLLRSRGAWDEVVARHLASGNLT
ncbi:MAG: HAD-IIIA family hydrolase [Phycisphaerales bacterium]|nr:HAD-IIIA family hydrolase [Phycisphaerales bacterium]